MLGILEAIENELPELLVRPAGWGTLDVNYHPPCVERLMRRWGDYRICLHRIPPCDSSEALFHPHLWPSAMHILSGTYEMAVGYDAGNEPPPAAATLIAECDMKYEMVDPNSWHYGRPFDEVAMIIMVTGQPWDRWSPGGDESFRTLSDDTRDEILAFFRAHFVGRGFQPGH